ncbi:MAG: hypothetical protein EA424_22020 [Planctomycetaceae bacterium]|nr:MAG: hypothetical protein EA424_22020 [Planctomycetaceae bacterium]
MHGDQQGAVSLTRREALHIGLGTLLGSAVAVTGTRAEDGKAAADTTEQERLAISFWNFGLLSTGPNSIFNALEMHMAETVQRGFNCIRTECGTGITHDAEGRPRGELEFYPVLPGHDHFTRELQHVRGGRIDLLKRLIELCTVAKRHNVKLILSSWYYLHTFWFTDKNVTAELLGLPLEKRFMYFARGLDRILEELKQRGLADTIATAEIFNEVGPRHHGKTVDHEEALDFLQTRHPDILFSLDTDSFDTSRIPRNAQVWTYHSYYLWPIYGLLEQDLIRGDKDLNDPAAYAPIRRFLRRDLVPFQAILDSRAGRPPIARDWFRRIWLYRNLDPNAMPELERLLQEHLEKNIDRFKQRATNAVEQAMKVRDELFPGIPLVLGEGASYCADHRLRWEERSDAYWEVVEHAARTWREHGFWGAVPRTNSGPTDPVWHEYPERLQRANAVFLGEKP